MTTETTPPETPTPRWRRWGANALVVAALAAVVASLVGIKGAQIGLLIEYGQAMAQAGPPPEVVEVEPVEARPLDLVFETIGTLSARQGVALSAPVGGLLVELPVESGQRVDKGAVIARLDTRVLRAALAKAEVQVRLARKTLARHKPLLAEGAVAATRLETHEATLAQAQADVREIRARIEERTIRAPFAGQLGLRAVNVGRVLDPGTVIVRLQATDDPLWLDFSVPQRKMRDLAVGAAVTVRVPGGASRPARVESVAPQVDAKTRARRVRAAFETPAAGLWPGMHVEVVWRRQLPARPVVPTVAVHRGADGPWVYRADQTDQGLRATRQPIRLGALSGDWWAVEEGLAAGDAVVVDGGFKLYDGAPISPPPVQP